MIKARSAHNSLEKIKNSEYLCNSKGKYKKSLNKKG